MKRSHWRWHLAYWRRLLGWPGQAGVALLVVGVLLYGASVIPDRWRAAGLRREIAATEAAARAGAVPREQGPEFRLAAFYQAFPERASAGAWLEKVYAAGNAAGLVLDKGEYRLDPDRDARLVRYEINLPVRGGYPQVRQFIRAVLAEIPSMALSDVQFRRGVISEPAVEARIRFVLYLREAA